MRLRVSGEDRVIGYRRRGPGPLLWAMWHGDFFPFFHYARHCGVCIVVSRSPDGEILHRLVRANGYRTVRGSTTRGATRSLIDLVRVTRKGSDAAIAVDGPRGPVLEAKAGIVLLAKTTGCPIVPLGVGMSRYKQFASWDRFRLPFPFSRVVLVGGEAIAVPADASGELLEHKRRELERSMLALRERGEQLVQTHQFHKTDRPRGDATAPPRPH